MQKGDFTHDGHPRLLQPISGPALGGLHELGHLSKGTGESSEPGTPAFKGPQFRHHSQPARFRLFWMGEKQRPGVAGREMSSCSRFPLWAGEGLTSTLYLRG